MRHRHLPWFGLVLIILLGLCLVPTPTAHAETAPEGWIATGLDLTTITQPVCVDSANPHTLIAPMGEPVTSPAHNTSVYALDWQTGHKTFLKAILLPSPEDNFMLTCGNDGMIYEQGTSHGPATRFSLADPQGQPIAFMPSHLAKDGSDIVYFFGRPLGGQLDGQLWASLDRGTTWQRRDTQFAGFVQDFVVSPIDARDVYALVSERTHGTPRGRFSVYFSADAGATWQKRSSGEADGIPTYDRWLIAALIIPEGKPNVDTVVLTLFGPSSGMSAYGPASISTDGGRTFIPQSKDAGFAYTSTLDGIVRETVVTAAQDPYTSRCDSYRIDRSQDGGVTWFPTAVPDVLDSGPECAEPIILTDPQFPSDLFLSQFGGSTKGLWYSSDSGQTWQKIAAAVGNPILTAALPLSLFSQTNGTLYIMDRSEVGPRVAAATAANHAPADLFFPQTRHNLSHLFTDYWQQHGGLAQFGYPKTEAFRELNPADNHIYTVQYFERARFEYHPEAPQEYRVLLGLLGNQLTATRKAAGEGAFTYFQDQHYPGGTYFPQTGHNLRNDFKKYWDAHGGLALYGYPTSEEFYEQNPDDGKTYVVQYFERNRFEYHPENTGTPYVVLLGLLGTAVLREKGWVA